MPDRNGTDPAYLVCYYLQTHSHRCVFRYNLPISCVFNVL